jgi:hypothetical protein
MASPPFERGPAPCDPLTAAVFFDISLALLFPNLACMGVDRVPTRASGSGGRLSRVQKIREKTIAMRSEPDREIAIFTEALKIAPRERDAFLARSCAGNEESRRKVEALLSP